MDLTDEGDSKTMFSGRRIVMWSTIFFLLGLLSGIYLYPQLTRLTSDAYVETNTDGGTTTTTSPTNTKVFDSLYKQGMTLAQQEKFINDVDDYLRPFFLNTVNKPAMDAFQAATNKVITDPAYVAAYKVNNTVEMKRIVDAAYAPLIPTWKPVLDKLSKIYTDNNGKFTYKLTSNNNRVLGLETALAIAVEEPAQIDAEFKPEDWKPLKWPKGWEIGPGTPPFGDGTLRNPKGLPGWGIGYGDKPGGGSGAIIKPPGSGGWGGTITINGGVGVGVGYGDKNGGGWIGIGGGGAVSGGVVIKF